MTNFLKQKKCTELALSQSVSCGLKNNLHCLRSDINTREMNKISIVTESQSNRKDASQQAPFEREKGRKLNLERH